MFAKVLEDMVQGKRAASEFTQKKTHPLTFGDGHPQPEVLFRLHEAVGTCSVANRAPQLQCAI